METSQRTDCLVFKNPFAVALTLFLLLYHFLSAIVHIDVAAAETGCSRFGERAEDADSLHHWTYSKVETHTSPEEYLQYTHLLTGNPKYHQDRFIVLEEVQGYAGIGRQSLSQLKKTCRPVEILQGGVDTQWDWKTRAVALLEACSPVKIKKEGQIWIMKQAWGY